MRELTVGAHPDDLEIACGGTIALCAKRGDEVVMAHVTNGSDHEQRAGMVDLVREARHARRLLT